MLYDDYCGGGKREPTDEARTNEEDDMHADYYGSQGNFKGANGPCVLFSGEVEDDDDDYEDDGSSEEDDGYPEEGEIDPIMVI